MTEELKKELIKELNEYLKENIEDFELKAQLAWSRMDKWRAPLDHVDPSFNDEITDKVQEWLFENIENEDLI